MLAVKEFRRRSRSDAATFELSVCNKGKSIPVELQRGLFRDFLVDSAAYDLPANASVRSSKIAETKAEPVSDVARVGSPKLPLGA